MSKKEKIMIIFLVGILVFLNIFVLVTFYKIINNNKYDEQQTFQSDSKSDKIYKKKMIIDGSTREYEVYQNDVFVKSFMNYDEAVLYASSLENASIKRYGGDVWLWDNTPQFNVYLNQTDVYTAFVNFSDAVKYARENKYADIYFRKNNNFIWNNHEKLKNSFLIKDVPSISQYPELYRGCEVTSLAMILQYKGVSSANKMILAENIKKDTTPYKYENGEAYYGNPNNGFVGDIYNSSKRGFGVYHKPIHELLSQYVGNDALDLTGCNFEDLYYFINKNIPIWVITNSKFEPLPESSFTSWITPEGKIHITYSEHAVVVVGYDDKYIYINDPMKTSGNIKKDKDKFISSWIQMGRQAVTYSP